MIVWLNGTHGAVKTTTAALLAPLLPGARVLHADAETLHRRIVGDTVLGPSEFRLAHLEPYAEAARSWLHEAGEVVDTTGRSAVEVAHLIAATVR